MSVVFLVFFIATGCTEIHNIFTDQNGITEEFTIKVKRDHAKGMKFFASIFADSLNTMTDLQSDNIPYFLTDLYFGGGLISNLYLTNEPNLCLKKLTFDQVENKEILISIIAYPDTLFDQENFPDLHGFVDTISYIHISTRELARIRLAELNKE